MKQRKLSLYMNLLGVLCTAVFIATVIQFFSKKVEIGKVYVVNQTGNSVSIVWYSDDAGEYDLVYSENNSRNPMFLRDYEKSKDNYESAGQSGKSRLHYNTLEDLKTDTNYYVWVKDKYARLTKLEGYEIRLPSVSRELKTPNPIYGRVLNSKRSVVFVTTGEAKYSITTIPNKDGNWSLDASLLNLDKIDENTEFDVKVLNESSQLGKLTVDYGSAKPTPTIVINKKQQSSLAGNVVTGVSASKPDVLGVAASSGEKCEGWADTNTIHWNQTDGYCYLCNSSAVWDKLDKEIDVYGTKYNKPPEYTAPSQAEWCRAVYNTNGNLKARSEWESIGGGCQNSWSPDGSVHWNIVTNKCYCCDPLAKTWESPYSDSPPSTGSTVDRTAWCRDTGKTSDGKTYGQNCSLTGETIYPDAEPAEDAPELPVPGVKMCPEVKAIGLASKAYMSTTDMSAIGTDGQKYECNSDGMWSIPGTGGSGIYSYCLDTNGTNIWFVGAVSCPVGMLTVIPSHGDVYEAGLYESTIPSGLSPSLSPVSYAATDQDVSGKGRYKITYGQYSSSFINLSNSAVKVKAYIDSNKNNKKDADEQYVDNFEVKKEGKDVMGLDLQVGWNLINLPFDPGQNTLKEFVDYLEAHGANITHAWIKGEVVTFREYNEYGNDIDLEPGQPLFILNQSKTLVVIEGQDVVEDMNTVKVESLTSGWHLASFSKAANGRDAMGILDELREKNKKIQQIAAYKNGQYWVIIVDDQGVKYGNTFLIYPEDGVFIQVE